MARDPELPGVCVFVRRLVANAPAAALFSAFSERSAGQFRARARLPDRARSRGAPDQSSGGHRLRRKRPDVCRRESRLSRPARRIGRDGIAGCHRPAGGQQPRRAVRQANRLCHQPRLPERGHAVERRRLRQFCSRPAVSQGHHGRRRRGRTTRRPDGIRRDTDAADSLQPPDHGDRQLDLPDQRADGRSRQQSRSPRSRGGKVLDQRFTRESLHARLRIDGGAGSIWPHLRRRRPPFHLLQPPSRYAGRARTALSDSEIRIWRSPGRCTTCRPSERRPRSGR